MSRLIGERENGYYQVARTEIRKEVLSLIASFGMFRLRRGIILKEKRNVLLCTMGINKLGGNSLRKVRR